MLTERTRQMRRLSVLCFSGGLTFLNSSSHPEFSSKHGGSVQIKGLDLESLIHGIRAQTVWLFERFEKACFSWVTLSLFSDHWWWRRGHFRKEGFLLQGNVWTMGAQGQGVSMNILHFQTVTKEVERWLLFLNSNFWQLSLFSHYVCFRPPSPVTLG